MFGVARAEAGKLPPHRVQVVERNVGEQQVLVVAGSYQPEAVQVRQIGERLHLRGGHVAGRNVGGLERDEDRPVARTGGARRC